MHLVIAEDDLVSQRVLRAQLEKWGFDPVVASDGEQALKMIRQHDGPSLAILDWMMPRRDGLEVCRELRTLKQEHPPYVILLTARGRTEDIVAGLNAGASDFLTKPTNHMELRARIDVGVRFLKLQSQLVARVRELEHAIGNIQLLEGLLPICCYCKKIRDDQNYWQQVEDYLVQHANAQLSHGVCPACYEDVLKPQITELRESTGELAQHS